MGQPAAAAALSYASAETVALAALAFTAYAQHSTATAGAAWREKGLATRVPMWG